MQGRSQSDGKLTECNNPEKDNPYVTKEAGCYYLGPDVKKYVRNLIPQYLAREKGTDDYYLMKMLVINDTKDNIHERVAFHTEYTMLSLLRGHPGVVQIHDFFRDTITIEKPGDGGREEAKRVFMVMECLIPHGGRNQELVPLHKYLSEKKKLDECEALHIFNNILLVIDDLHKKNIVHKDLKLSNVILDRQTLKIKLINFYYAKQVSSEMELSYMQKGNPSYMAPETIIGKPVPPMPCDMRSAGVILYALLHGNLPLVGGSRFSLSSAADSRSLADIYTKIIANDYVISDDLNMSESTKLLIRGLLSKDPRSRLKSSEALDFVRTIFAVQSTYRQRIYTDSQCCNQVVPECQMCAPKRRSPPGPREVTESEPEMAEECAEPEMDDLQIVQ